MDYQLPAWVTGFATALGIFITLALKWKKENAQIKAEAAKSKVTLEVETKKTEGDLQIKFDRESIEQWKEIVKQYESTLAEQAKQHQERELQFQDMFDKQRKHFDECFNKLQTEHNTLRLDHVDCLQNNARMEERVRMLEMQSKHLEEQVGELHSRLEARSAKRYTDTDRPK